MPRFRVSVFTQGYLKNILAGGVSRLGVNKAGAAGGDGWVEVRKFVAFSLPKRRTPVVINLKTIYNWQARLIWLGGKLRGGWRLGGGGGGTFGNFSRQKRGFH